MKKIFSLLFACFFLTIVSCTSDIISDPKKETTYIPSFNYTIDGETNTNAVTEVLYDGNLFNLNFPDGRLSFDTNGHLGYFELDLVTVAPNLKSKYSSYKNYSSHFFTFKLIAIDDVKRTIKGSFSGYIYADPLDLKSDKKFVSGDFDIPFYGVNVGNQDSYHYNLIKNQNWNRTNYYTTKEEGNNNYIQHDLSDDEYKIMIYYNIKDISVGEFYYADQDVSNKIKIAKFDTITNTYINYNCVGTLKILAKEGNVIQGHYSLIARNPIDSSFEFQLTEGLFQLVHPY